MKAVFLVGEKLKNNLFDPMDIAEMKKHFDVDDNPSGEDPAQQNIRERIAGADIVITSWGTPNLDQDALEGSDVKLVVHAAGSVKPVVSDALWDQGIKVSSAACALGIGVAETALGFTILSLKDIPFLSRYTAQGNWRDTVEERVREVFRVKIGIVSGGHVGRHYAKLLQAFDVDAMMYDPYLSAEQMASLGVRKVEMDELLSTSDVISLHAPSIDATHHMISAEALTKMKKNAILINTARGSLIDEKALYIHMAAGNLLYACIDVTDPEPPAPDHPLRSLSNVIMTPHIAGLCTNGQRRIGAHALQEMLAFQNGTALKGEVTREMIAFMA